MVVGGAFLAVISASTGHSQDALMFLNFEGTPTPGGIPLTTYASQYTGEGGRAAVSTVAGAGVGSTAGYQFKMSAGYLYAQFNPYKGGLRYFARDFAPTPSAWAFNTYNRLGFWVKNPTNGAPMQTGGRASLQVGTYVKRVANADKYSDETGGGHYYHHVNLPNTGTWTKVILNAHPHHKRSASGSEDQRNLPHPTGELNYNYFDALTRFYVNETGNASSTANYVFDEFRFYEESAPENDDQIYSIAATFVPDQNRYILTWSRHKDQNYVKHEVRYSTQNIHGIGWSAATPAPSGIISPPGYQGYNGMVYNTTAIPAASVIYFAIKPENSSIFSQISLGAPPPVSDPVDPAPCNCSPAPCTCSCSTP